MKNYKDYTKEVIGSSDIAALVLVGCDNCGIKTTVLHFGSDGVYKAYIVDQDTEVPEHYRLVDTFTDWLKIYDDEELTYKVYAKEIKVYRAAEMGCVIQVVK